MTPDQTKPHQDEIVYQKKKKSYQDAVDRTKIWNNTKSNKIALRRKISQGEENSYQDSVDRTKV